MKKCLLDVATRNVIEALSRAVIIIDVKTDSGTIMNRKEMTVLGDKVDDSEAGAPILFLPEGTVLRNEGLATWCIMATW